MTNYFTVLGIETGCDDTAVALVRGNGQTPSTIIGMTTLTQSQHQIYGGVVPEIAARAHLSALPKVLKNLLAQHAEMTIDGVAVTTGPGLIGGLIAGVSLAKGLAGAWKVPLLSVNHLYAHALSVRIAQSVAYPYLMLLTSGGHCQILAVYGVDNMKIWGTTRDDAPGEAFDKVAKMMGLPYPGGPVLEQLAQHGDSTRFVLPRPNFGHDSCDFSFSGLKTAVLRQLEKLSVPLTTQDKADIAACFQHAVADCLTVRAALAMQRFAKEHSSSQKVFATAGGVASNKYIRQALERLCQQHNFSFVAPEPALCTDNGAMIAHVGIEQLSNNIPHTMHSVPYARSQQNEKILKNTRT